MTSEISWFSALCDDDYEFLGDPDPNLRSSWAHCRNIVTAAETGGFDNILLPSGYALGIDGTAFAAGIAAITNRIKLLLAVRCGEMWPPQLARQLATLDQMLQGRLTINIISSDMPGETRDGLERYARTLEVMHILKELLSGRPINHQGEFYQLELDPPRICAERTDCPPFYFGGLSPPALDVAAKAADVFLMWPSTEDKVQAILDDVRGRAASEGRTLRYGYRAHIVIGETEDEARARCRRLLSHFDADAGGAIRSKSLDAATFGVAKQAELRAAADDEGFVEDGLWTGIGRARSGAGAAIVGDPDQVLAKIRRYEAMGFDSFILSGYPHIAECDLFARYVLPELKKPAA
ncbi:MAG: LLM class flavin-dependent oxidoreductase [Pseudomonadota bacterium]